LAAKAPELVKVAEKAKEMEKVTVTAAVLVLA
jgi:hypothetical protein